MGTILGIKEGSKDASYGYEKRDKLLILVKQFTLTYYVLADSINDTEDDVLSTSGIPPLFYPLNGAYTQGYNPKEMQTVIHPVTGVKTTIWEVEVEFDSNVDINEEDEPTQKTPVVRWSGETEEELLDKDPVTGDAIVTDAEEPILINAPIILPVLEIKRYEFYPFDPNVMLSFAHHVNSTTFWGAPPGSALMLPMDVDEETIDGEKFAVVTYRIKFKIKPGLDEPWKARVLHHGYKYRPESGAEPIAATDKTGNPITVNLKNGEGTKLPDGATPHFKTFNRFPKTNLNSLSLGPF